MKGRKGFVFLALLNLILSLPLTIQSAERTYLGELNFGARSVASGGCVVTARNDLATLYSNPAALGIMTGNAISNVSFNNQFGIVGWTEKQIAIAFRPWGPLRTGLLRVNNTANIYEEAGTNLWRDTRTVFSLGMRLSESVAIGANYQRFNSFLEVDSEIKSQDYNLMNFGLLYAGKRLSWGMAAHNLEILTDSKQVMPDFHFGMEFCYEMIDCKFELVNYETAFSGLRKWSINTGAEMEFAPGLILRIGNTISEKTSNFVVGFGISWKNITIDYAYTTPYNLKASHHISTSYHF